MAPDNAYNQWLNRLAASVAAGDFVKLTLSKPTTAAIDLKSIDVRPIVVKRVLKLSFTYHHKTRDVVKNFSAEESRALLDELLADQFTAARLCTLAADFQLTKTGAGWGMLQQQASQTQAPVLTHDRAKKRWVESADKPYLHALGITDAQGKVIKSAQDKFRQINKYIEILDGLIKQLPGRACLRIVDMGAGKGYLTFALYDYLTHTLQMNVELVGVEYRADLVTQCNDIAAATQFNGLQFVQGSIADYDCNGADVVIALHACDTATDDAIHKAIRADAALIVVAPCCHKQIRRVMAKPSQEHPLAFLMQYGTYMERLGEMVTDGMRAQIMELHGYRTNLFEFIADAHTPKNVMIVAVKANAAPNAKTRSTLEDRLAATKAQFGIAYHQLERLLS